jgi:hypothetical protein
VSPNRRHGHWSLAAHQTRVRMLATKFLALDALIHLGSIAPLPSVPKRVRYEAHVKRSWDDDNLLAAMKPYRDGLVAGKLLHADDRASGHVFDAPTEVIDRAWQGVLITVEPLYDEPPIEETA